MGRKNPNIHPNAKQASSFLSFFLYFSSLMLFISLFFFLFWCGMLFYLCPSCFQQWLEVLKTIWMVCSLVIPNRDWGRKYDLWTSNTLIHCHQSWECREWIYQASFLLQGLPEPRYHWGSFETWIINRPLSIALMLIISKNPYPFFKLSLSQNI